MAGAQAMKLKCDHGLKVLYVPAEETNRIVHVVLSHHGELEYGSPIVPATAEAILVNHLDNLSAKLDVIETTGNMEKAFALGTHVIKNEK